MAGFAQDEAAGFVRADARDDAVEDLREFGFGEDQFEAREGFSGGRDGRGMGAEARGEFAQDAMDFAGFFFGEADEFVVEVDGFHRLDEEGVAAAAGSVDDSVDAAFAAGDNRDYKTVVADGDEIFLQRAVGLMGAQEAFERVLDGLALLLDLAAEAAEGDTGVVG